MKGKKHFTQITMEEVNEKLKNFLINSNASGVELNCLPSFSSASRQKDYLRYSYGGALGRHKYLLVLAFLICAIGRNHLNELANEDCILEMPTQLQKAFRPPESCNFCSGIRNVPRISNVDPDEFERRFAYGAGPVIVTDATANWTATETFSYWFFKQIYETYGSRRAASRCQFFPYKTGFRNLKEALSLDEARVNYEPGTEPWYFGWSNCDPVILKVLREHYGRPYFLPKASENNAVDWVFMGGTGLGAHMHNIPVWLGNFYRMVKYKRSVPSLMPRQRRWSSNPALEEGQDPWVVTPFCFVSIEHVVKMTNFTKKNIT